ncbi:MAG: YdcF family protein, partial [Syntrophus sp. (in: bacteria)]|nr:YdcF family protein [Syntrophus sp. (in: bacteria)]
LISGGNVFGREPEAEVTKRFLKSLGVKESDIIPESKSQDTFENARFTRDICKEKGIKSILLITNAYHMRRSVMLFHKYFSDILPYPTGYKVSEGSYNLFSFLPDASNIAGIATALKEYMGILFYKITL